MLRLRVGIIIVAITASILCGQVAIYVFSASQPDVLSDLSGTWNMCIPADAQADCNWSSVHAPGYVDTAKSPSYHNWIMYRKSVAIPSECLRTEEACEIIIGEVGDAVEMRLNGVVVGRHGGFPPHATYAKHIPVRFSLSRHILNVAGSLDTVELLVYSSKKNQVGIRRGPFAIVSNVAAAHFVRARVAEFVVLPIISAGGLALLVIFCLWYLSRVPEAPQVVHYFILHATVATVFLISFTEIPREYFPLSIAGPIHFGLRIVYDWTLYELVAAFFSIAKKWRWASRVGYWLVIAAYAISFWGSLGFDGAYWVMRAAFPLLLLPVFVGTWKSWGMPDKAGRFQMRLGFTVVAPLLISDILVFHQVITLMYFVKIYPLFLSMAFVWCFISDYYEKNQVLYADAKIGRLAAQVAHDIRSPLAALKVVTQYLAVVPEEQRILIRNAVQRIDDIANNLAGRRPQMRDCAVGDTEESASVQLLSAIIEPLISEKRLQFRSQLGVEIVSALEASSYGVFVSVQPQKMKRVLSNLVNNAVEALANEGAVTVGLMVVIDQAQITVCDTGRGIPADRLPYLAQRGATFEKSGGSGLGLYHARTTVEEWGGQLAIASEIGRGTTITVQLPLAVSPDWFVPEVVLRPGMTIAIVDDDASIHQIWENRLVEALNLEEHRIELQHFSSGADVTAWYHEQANTLFLCDYEFLGSAMTGLELIETLNIASQAILVTSHYEDPPVREACAKLGVRLIPKGLAGFVPLAFAAEQSVTAVEPAPATGPTPTTILVLDDDDGIRLAWQLEQPRLGIGTLHVHASMEACVVSAPDFAQIDCAFVDKHIKGSDWTLEATIKHLKAGGVKKVVVASGESARDLAADPVCALADGILPDKIPESLRAYVVGAVSAVEG